MELGRTDELTILTPDERAWIERALKPAGRNVMAEAALKAGLGRRLGRAAARRSLASASAGSSATTRSTATNGSRRPEQHTI